jgi:hypothetical protein
MVILLSSIIFINRERFVQYFFNSYLFFNFELYIYICIFIVADKLAGRMRFLKLLVIYLVFLYHLVFWWYL